MQHLRLEVCHAARATGNIRYSTCDRKYAMQQLRLESGCLEAVGGFKHQFASARLSASYLTSERCETTPP